MQPATFILLMLWAVPVGAQTLLVVPDKIQVGEDATLNWDVTGARAFVLGYGEVTGKGSATISPKRTTDYILIAQYQGTDVRYEHIAQRLVVTGGRSVDEMPSLADFGTPISGSSRSDNYIEFQKNTWDLLQTDGYTVRGDFAPSRPYVTLYTDFVLRPDLVTRGEKIRARRLALAIDIYQPGKDRSPIHFGVHTFLEFQYRGETEWRRDKDSPLAAVEARNAIQRLGGPQ